MKGIESIQFKKNEVLCVFEKMTSILKFIEEESMELIQYPKGPSYREYPDHYNRTVIPLIEKTREINIRINSYKKDVELKRLSSDTSFANEVYLFLKEELFKSDFYSEQFRPLLRVFTDVFRNYYKKHLYISSQSLLEQARTLLDEQLPKGVCFYADIMPYGILGVGSKQRIHIVIELVNELMWAIKKYYGFIIYFHGTDTIRGFIPEIEGEIEGAYKFLTKEIHIVTTNYLRTLGQADEKMPGWSIGASYGEGWIHFAEFQPYDGDSDPVGESAHLMEDADSCSRLEYRQLKKHKPVEFRISGKLIFFSQKLFEKIFNSKIKENNILERNDFLKLFKYRKLKPPHYEKDDKLFWYCYNEWKKYLVQ